MSTDITGHIPDDLPVTVHGELPVTYRGETVGTATQDPEDPTKIRVNVDAESRLGGLVGGRMEGIFSLSIYAQEAIKNGTFDTFEIKAKDVKIV